MGNYVKKKRIWSLKCRFSATSGHVLNEAAVAVNYKQELSGIAQFQRLTGALGAGLRCRFLPCALRSGYRLICGWNHFGSCSSRGYRWRRNGGGVRLDAPVAALLREGVVLLLISRANSSGKRKNAPTEAIQHEGIIKALKEGRCSQRAH